MNVATIDRTPVVTVAGDSISHLRHIVVLAETQAREGKIRWQGTDGIVRSGHLWRGVRNSDYTTTPSSDPRGAFVLVTDLDRTDHLLSFDHLVSLFDAGLLQVR
jgi:hypothetical protein